MHQDQQQQQHNRGRRHPTALIKVITSSSKRSKEATQITDNQSRPLSLSSSLALALAASSRVAVLLDKERRNGNGNQCFSNKTRKGAITTMRRKKSSRLFCQPLVDGNHRRNVGSSHPSVANWASRSVVLVLLFAHIGCLLIWLAAATHLSAEDTGSGHQINQSASAAANLWNPILKQANFHHPHHHRHPKSVAREQIAKPSAAVAEEALLHHHRHQIAKNEISSTNEANDLVESKQLTQIRHPGDRSKLNQNNHNIKSTSGSLETSSSVSSPTIAQQLKQRSNHQVPEQLPIVVSYSDNSYVSASPYEQQQQQTTTTAAPVAPSPTVKSRSTSSRYMHRTSYPHHSQHLQAGNKRGQPPTPPHQLTSKNRVTTATISKYSFNRAIRNSRRAVSHTTNQNQHQQHPIQKSSQPPSRLIGAERRKHERVQRLAGSQSRAGHSARRLQSSQLIPTTRKFDHREEMPKDIPKLYTSSHKQHHHHHSDDDADHDDEDDYDSRADHHYDRDRGVDINIDMDHDNDNDDDDDDSDFDDGDDDNDHDDDDDDDDGDDGDDDDNDLDLDVDVDDDDLDADDGYRLGELNDDSGLDLYDQARRRKSRRLQRFRDRLHLGRDLSKLFRHISSSGSSTELTNLSEATAGATAASSTTTTTTPSPTTPKANHAKPSDNEIEETLHGLSWMDSFKAKSSEANNVRVDEPNNIDDRQQQLARYPGQISLTADADDEEGSSMGPVRSSSNSRNNFRSWSFSKGSIGSINSNSNNLNNINNPNFGEFEASSDESSIKDRRGHQILRDDGSLLSSRDTQTPQLPRSTLFNGNDGDDTTRWGQQQHLRSRHHNQHHHHQLEAPPTPSNLATNLRRSSVDVASNVPHYSNIVAGLSNHYSFDGRRQWHDSHIASISIGQEEFSEYGKGGLNSAIIAIIFGIGATGMLIVIVGHKMKSIRKRIAIKGQRRSLVPDADFLINTIPI